MKRKNYPFVINHFFVKEVYFMPEITLYIDIYLFVNLFINGFLIYITSVLICKKLKFIRLFVSDIIASAFGLIICLPQMNIFLILIIKFISNFIITILAYGNEKIIKLLKNTFILTSVSITYSAVSIWGSSIFSLKNFIYINNNEIYYNFPVPFLISIMMFFLIFYSILKKRIQNKKTETLLYDCLIELNGKRTMIRGFLDTGNSLKDVISGLPVIVIGRNVAENLLQDTEKFLALESISEKLNLIPYRNADGSRNIMPAFKPDKVTLNGSDVDVVVAVSKENFCNEMDFGCLLNKNCIV